MSESKKTIQEECCGTCWRAQQRIDELTHYLNAANKHINRLIKAGERLSNEGPTGRNVLAWELSKEAKP